jgi:ABC-2 type transport system ATP-binding protein
LDGEIEIFGHPVQNQALLARRQLAYVPEQAAVYGHLSAIENINYFLSLADIKISNNVIATHLSQVGLNQQSWHKPCSEYSKGMKQKVMLALALAKQAKLLLMDEPNSGLDPQATEELNQLIVKCKNDGLGVLVVTHDILSAIAFSDQLMMLSNGHLTPVTLDPTRLTIERLTHLYQGGA